jgi:hypothetical protein
MSDQTSGRTSRWLAIYLRNHEAAASAGADLFARMAGSQRRRPWGPELVAVGAEVEQDLRTLRGLLRSLGVRPDPLSSLALRAGERVGRLKPNGRLVRRSPLSDLVEVEAGLDAVHAKAAGWAALRAVPRLDAPADLDELARRAEDQLRRMRVVHATVAAAVL